MFQSRGFDNLAGRVKTQDNDMFVSSINILRETGGNLAETFDTIVGVIRESRQTKGNTRAQTIVYHCSNAFVIEELCLK